MTDCVLALDLGTGSCKASLWDADGAIVDETTSDYPTSHPRPGWHEQSLDDWWSAAVNCTRALVDRHDHAVAGIAVSGHSLGVILLDAQREPLQRSTPIWSDSRASPQAERLFAEIDETSWYLRTGGGFTPALYPLFKARWYAEHEPELWAATRHVLGSKDWINLKLTGEIATDHSYASGSGVYSLADGAYDDELVSAGGLTGLLPVPRRSHEPVGSLDRETANALGLAAGIPVFTGAVDNAAMALGSRGTRNGRLYAALGSSSWMTLTGSAPVLDAASRPFVFAHAVPGHYVSALSTFSSGTSLSWLHQLVGSDVGLPTLLDAAMALTSDTDVPTFCPTLAGGTPLEGGSGVRGVLAHLDLSHGREHVVRAAMEGIAFTMRRSLDVLRSLASADRELLISGAGARHDAWNQLYADVLGQSIVRTSVDQQAAALGAASIAFVGLGLWSFDDADRPHIVKATYRPDAQAASDLEPRRQRFEGLERTLAATRGTLDIRQRSTP